MWCPVHRDVDATLCNVEKISLYSYKIHKSCHREWLSITRRVTRLIPFSSHAFFYSFPAWARPPSFFSFYFLLSHFGVFLALKQLVVPFSPSILLLVSSPRSTSSFTAWRNLMIEFNNQRVLVHSFDLLNSDFMMDRTLLYLQYNITGSIYFVKRKYSFVLYLGQVRNWKNGDMFPYKYIYIYTYTLSYVCMYTKVNIWI